jgi:hypothetical protein
MTYQIKNLTNNEIIFTSTNLKEAQDKFQELMLTKPDENSAFYFFEEII